MKWWWTSEKESTVIQLPNSIFFKRLCKQMLYTETVNMRFRIYIPQKVEHLFWVNVHEEPCDGNFVMQSILTTL